MNLSKARVLISNDDGIAAPGLKLLQKAIKPLVKEVWIVAPVNADAVTSIEPARQGRRKTGGVLTPGTDPRDEAYYWAGPQREEDRARKGTNLEAVLRGTISVTPLTLDLTHTSALRKLKVVQV